MRNEETVKYADVDDDDEISLPVGSPKVRALIGSTYPIGERRVWLTNLPRLAEGWRRLHRLRLRLLPDG